jgi:hypothetical protein
MLPTIMSRGPIDLWTRTPRFIAPFSASAPSHHNLSSVDFITNIAESDFWYTQRSYSRPKPRRFPLDRGFLRSAQGQSGDEASAGHSLAVGRTRYVKGRQALREKYITTGRSIEMVACIMPDGHPRSTAAIQSAHPPNFRFVHCSVSLTKLHGLPTFQS